MAKDFEKEFKNMMRKHDGIIDFYEPLIDKFPTIIGSGLVAVLLSAGIGIYNLQANSNEYTGASSQANQISRATSDDLGYRIGVGRGYISK